MPPNDAAALADAIRATLADPVAARAMAARGRALVAARHSVEAAMARTVAVYEAVLAR
ncbi:MAG TPA: glycosyltransferase [Candidatus Tectomicrobia bacterium]|nr:glycosyltransferase [Candidatus Tectomicrobia bacterium]